MKTRLGFPGVLLATIIIVKRTTGTFDGHTSARDVFDKLEQLFEWEQFHIWMDEEVSNDYNNYDYIFRADICDLGSSKDRDKLPSFRANIFQEIEENPNPKWDTGTQLTLSLDDFAIGIGKHLNKDRAPYESRFVSTSPDLEWTVHKTGCKVRDCSASGVAGLAIFSTAAIRKIDGATLFEVDRLLDYYDQHGKGHHVPEQLRVWARNCQERVSINYLPREALVNWVAWTDLYSPSIKCLLPPEFSYYYTLGLFRKRHSLIEIEMSDYAERIVAFAQALVGKNCSKSREFGKLVVTASYWGYSCYWTDEDLLRQVEGAFDNVNLRRKLSRVEL